MQPSKVQNYMWSPWNDSLDIQGGMGWAGPDGRSRKKMGINLSCSLH